MLSKEEKIEKMVAKYREHTEEGYTDPEGVSALLEFLMEEEPDKREALMKGFEEALKDE